jgi:hypothetical protein
MVTTSLSNRNYFGFFGFLAVLADALKAASVGRPGAPGGFMRSPLPAFIRACFALMLEYNPGFALPGISMVR